MYTIYQVMPNETLDIIAQKTGTTKETLMIINGMNTENVIPGSYIVIPMNVNVPFSTYTVKKNDNLYNIAKNYNTDYQTLLEINGLNKDDYIYPNQELIIPNPEFKLYVTRENDTLSKVAKELGSTQEELIKENSNIYLQPEQLIIYKK